MQGSVSPRSAGGEDRAKTTAKWGAACASCAAAKAKCIRTNEEPGSKCDRCERLFKDCTDQIHRPRKKRASKPSKTAQLEERLNGLVDLLRATGELPTGVAAGVTVTTATGSGSLASRPDSTPTTSPYNPPSVLSATRDGSGPSAGPSAGPSPSDTRDVREPRDLRRDTGPYAPPPVIPSTYNSFAPPSCICRPETGETVTDSVESDNALLAKFRKHMHPQLPILVLPASVTAAQLAADRPFLFLAIRTVASVDNYRSMQGLMYQLVNHVADYMLLRAERSLDLLQGLLIVLSWYHHHCMMHAQLGNLLHLASSLLSDLGLTRPARLQERTDLMVLHPNPPSPRTHEERRILLGLWYIRSCVALCFQKTEPMRFTPYARQCLQELEDARDAETDATLVALVRMQILAEKIGAFNSRDESVDEVAYFPRAPKAAYKIAFQSELDQMVAALSDTVRKHVLIESHISSITLRLYEPPLLDLVLLRKLSTSLTSASSPMMATALDMLYSACSALKKFFDQFFSVSIHIYQWLPIPIYVNLVYSITMMSRWARLVGPTRPAQPNPNPNNLRGPAVLNSGGASAANGSSTAAATSSTSAAAGTATTVSSNSTPPTISSLDLKDPSYRLVPGQGVGATVGVGAGATSIPFTFIAGMEARELQRDPSLLATVSWLREHMRQQPDLQLDIPATLATIWDKFEQSNREMRAAGAAKFGDSVGRGMNVWDLTARKIAIMRFKVGRYLDGATAAADPHGSGNGNGGNGGGGDANESQRPAQNQDRQPQQQPQQPTFQPYLPYARQTQTYTNQSDTQKYGGAGLGMGQQQQLPMHTAQPAMPTFASGAGGTPTGSDSPGAGMAGMVPQLNGLPADLGSYVMGGQGVAAADLSFGLGNLEGWDNDPLWGTDLFGAGTDPGMWAENMDWVATLG